MFDADTLAISLGMVHYILDRAEIPPPVAIN